jgi:glyoxylase-like metal-dependent hydrolase (beta-lactamase superfamily II)
LSRNHGETAVAAMRTWESPVRTVVYTHGHFDHVGGMPFYDADAERRGLAPTSSPTRTWRTG